MVSGRRCLLLIAASIAAATATPALCAPDVLLEADITPQRVYVQAQAVYRLRFYQAVDVRDLKIIGPAARLADVRPIGAERVNEVQRDGRRYRVHERSYAIFPFASGALELGGAQASGGVAVANSPGGRRALQLDAPPRTLTVLPAPATADDARWLPAKSLALSETWSVSADGTQRRNIRIEAVGVDAVQLPETQQAASGMTIQAEPARIENRFAGEWNIGLREQSFNMVPSPTGALLVPELQVPWWNVNLDQPEVATLPARTLRSAPAVAPVDRLRAAPLLGTALLCALALWTYRQRGKLHAAWRLRRACRKADVHATRDALLAGAARIWRDTPPATLAALAERLDDPAARIALAGIERALYGPPPAACEAVMLTAAVRDVQRGLRRARAISAGYDGKRCNQRIYF